MQQDADECHHIHEKDEWTPKKVGGKLWFPSHEEAAYTAELAVGLSWWALRTGKATFKVPRAPRPVAGRSRVGWIDLEPAALRSWRMAVVGTRLGLGLRMVSLHAAKDGSMRMCGSQQARSRSCHMMRSLSAEDQAECSCSTRPGHPP